MAWFTSNRIARPVECPGCACEHAVRIAVSYAQAGDREERTGVVRDCVRCGTRYTALDAGGVVRYGAQGAIGARVGSDSVAGHGRAGANPGGAGDGAGASLFADMETLDT